MTDGRRPKEEKPGAAQPPVLDQDEWRLGGEKAGLEPDFGGVGTDPNYRGGSGVDQRGARRAQPHAQGDTRSDAAIEEDARGRLARFGHLDASEIDVSVARGEITLSGWVADEDEKRAAQDLVDAVPGMVAVHNLLHIRPAPAVH